MRLSALKQKPLIILVLLMCFSGAIIYGQDYGAFFNQSTEINNKGMLVLGTWAVANISIGAIGWSQSSGERLYFHQMNLFWNTVNLAIAGFAIFGNLTSNYALWPNEEILSKQLRTQNLFLINAGLDIGYMGVGLLLKNMALRKPNNQQRLAGYGNSVILQGAFLFVFDLIMYGLQRNHRMGFLDSIQFSPMSDAMGLSLNLTL